jgi:major membrane immunogen (membrane-anchored lipoprotein)
MGSKIMFMWPNRNKASGKPDREVRSIRSMVAAICLALLVAACASTEKRDMTAQLAVARITVADAMSVGAPEFAPVEMKAAEDKLNAAEKAAAEKDYKRAGRLAEEAQVNARLATSRTQAAKAQQAADALRESNRALGDEMNRAVKP